MTKLERAAQAIEAKSRETDALPSDICEQYAKVAIEALRHPSPKDLGSLDPCVEIGSFKERRKVWNAIVDVALGS